MKNGIPSVLLVGIGRWGQNYIRILLKLQAKGLCRLVGVNNDTNHSLLQYIGKEFGVRTFCKDDGFEESDAVIIAVPTHNHFTVAKRALLAGKDVLVEKPLTKTLEEAQELNRIHKTSSQVFMVGHTFRYNPALDYVKKLLSDREIGSIRFLRGRFMGLRPKEQDAGILATIAIHFIYLSNYIMGKTPKKVWAKTSYFLDSKLEDHCLVRLDYGREFSLIESDYFTPGKWRTFDIIGTQGAILLDTLNQKVELHQKKHIYTGGGFEVHDGNTLYPNIEFQEPLYLELSHFLDCIRQRTEPLTGIQDGIEVLQIIKAAYESSSSGETVTIEQQTPERRK